MKTLVISFILVMSSMPLLLRPSPELKPQPPHTPTPALKAEPLLVGNTVIYTDYTETNNGKVGDVGLCKYEYHAYRCIGMKDLYKIKGVAE